MCKGIHAGDYVELWLMTDHELSHSGYDRARKWKIDKCIAPIVEALQAQGIKMLGSCCGHGKDGGFISLADGRSLTFSSWQAVEQSQGGEK